MIDPTPAPSPEPRPKVRAEFTAFSATLRGLVATLHTNALGSGRFTFRIWDMPDGPVMAFEFEDGSRYIGPLWRSVDDMYRAVATMTAELLEEGK